MTEVDVAEWPVCRIAGCGTPVLRVDDQPIDLCQLHFFSGTSEDASDDRVRIRNPRTPASATAFGDQGDVCWDADYVYVCVAPNTWKRAALATW